MSEPGCPQSSPYGLELEAGVYFWCRCGHSANQPFCDGSHAGSEFSPVRFELTETKSVWLCGCKRSGNSYLCDGSHKNL